MQNASQASKAYRSSFLLSHRKRHLETVFAAVKRIIMGQHRILVVPATLFVDLILTSKPLMQILGSYFFSKNPTPLVQSSRLNKPDI